MGLDALITAILVLAVLGFICWLLFTKIQIASPFREIMMFLIVLLLVIWLLNFLGIWHGPAFRN